jgi:orotidine-5'-phosphate decarboxylase
MMRFFEKLQNAWQATGSMLCVGLDPRLESIPASLRRQPRPFFEFNRRVIDATLPFACAYKPQFACYAGADRLAELRETLAYLRETAADRVTILDAKRGDIGSTAEQYAREAFEVYGADAVTVNPYMGGDTLEPFTRHAERGVIVLCKTSNPGSSELQDLELRGGQRLFEEVARRAADDWNARGNLALVVGATWPRELARVRALVGDMPLLVPGIGAQGGDLEATLRAGLRMDGWGLLINSSRGIVHASSGEDFAEAAAAAAARLDRQCRDLRAALLAEGLA